MARDRLHPVDAINQIRLTAKNHARREFASAPDSIVDQVVDQVFNEMLDTLGQLRSRIRRHIPNGRGPQPHQAPSRGARASRPTPPKVRWCFDILGLAVGADPEEIRKRFLELVKTRHPDQGGTSQQFRDLLEAYRILTGR